MQKKISKYLGVIFICTGITLGIVLILSYHHKKKTHTKLVSERILNSKPELNILYPFNNTVLPPEISAQQFTWMPNFKNTGLFKIEIKTNSNTVYSASVFDTKWQPDSLVWEKMKSISKNNLLEFSVMAKQTTDSINQYIHSKISFSFSPDSVGAPIFYRQVDLPFTYAAHSLNSIEWSLGDISQYQNPRTLLKNINMCGNCHSFSNNGQYFGMDFNYQNDNGAFAITPLKQQTSIDKENFISWNKLSNDGYTSSGLLSSISPDGRYVISTINDKTITNLHENNFRFFPVEGQLAVYDKYTNKMWKLPGASDSLYVQCNAGWSADGKNIVFAKAHKPNEKELKDPKILKEYADGLRDFKFDLWTVPFNNGKGGQAEPLEGASNNGKSNYFPRISPNNKWIVFTQAQNYMLRQSDSKLMIIPLEGGKARELGCNLSKMNSWHSWSPNSKWIVFSTKHFSQFTKIALAHINEHGLASSPAILNNFTLGNKAANLPEFVNTHYNNFLSIETPFTEKITVESIDIKTIKPGKYTGKSIQSDSKLNIVSAITETKVHNGKIIEIRAIKTQGIAPDFENIFDKIIQYQTTDLFILNPQSNDEIVLIKAVEDGIKKGK
jgi:uncharacterized protein with FMN-binding domain